MNAAGEATATPRMFLAIPLPLDVQRRLARLVPQAAGVRPVAVGQMHVTLHFFADLAAAAVEPVAAAVAAVGWRAFPLALGGGGRFPPRGPATVIWVGVGPSEPLRELHAATGAAVEALGHPVESRPFAAHVTVARLQRHAAREAAAAFLAAAERLEPVEIPVDRFHLYRSDPAAEGRVHTIVREFLPRP